jgi:hypothetical protein
MKLGTQAATASTERSESRSVGIEIVETTLSTRIAVFATGLLALAAFVPELRAWEKSDILHAIHQVENPRDLQRAGQRGELGPFQFRRTVWSKYTEKPFSLATDPVEAQVVAEAHYDWIKRGLERNGLEVTPYQIGLAWNAGLHATVNNRASNQSKQYAQRVANLVEYADSTKKTAVSEQPAAAPSI